MSSAAAHDCPMTEECPAYDRDVRLCLVHPGDCDFAPADGAYFVADAFEAVVVREAPPAVGRTIEG